MAAKIMIVRHGEKPKKNELGVLTKGKKSKDSLIVRGWQRAGALAQLFRTEKNGLAVPTELHACYKSKHAQRALDTITPLAKVLGLTVNTKVRKGQEKKMAELAKASEGVVLISWEHDAIHLIANQLTADPVPQQWPDDRFDIVYVFDLVDGEYKFSQVPQLLLSGDSDKVIGPGLTD